MVKPSRRREMTEHAVRECGVSIRLAWEIPRISHSCCRYASKTNAENEQIVHRLIRQTDNRRTREFVLCFLVGVNYCDRPHMALGGMTPEQRLAMAA